MQSQEQKGVRTTDERRRWHHAVWSVSLAEAKRAHERAEVTRRAATAPSADLGLWVDACCGTLHRGGAAPQWRCCWGRSSWVHSTWPSLVEVGGLAEGC